MFHCWGHQTQRETECVLEEALPQQQQRKAVQCFILLRHFTTGTLVATDRARDVSAESAPFEPQR